MIPVITGIVLGVACGTISGLIPGIHTNTVAGIFLSLQGLLFPVLGPVTTASALLATLITHSFLDSVPSTLLGIPDEGTVVSVLPAHALTMKGHAEEAIRVSALGSLWGIIYAVPLSVAALVVLPVFQRYVDWGVGILLIVIMGVIIVLGESPPWSMAVFLVSGILGIFALKFQYLVSGWGNGSILMPLLTGLFGLSLLFTASDGAIPSQRFTGIHMEGKDIRKKSLFGTIGGVLVGWLPGLSTASANGLISVLIRSDQDGSGYIVAASASNTSNVMIALTALYAIGRTRDGVMVALSTIEIPPYIILLTTAVISSLIAYFITVFVSGSSEFFSGIDGKKINSIVIIFIIALSAAFTGPFGLFILLLSTALGFVPGIINIPRMYCIGAVTIPVILYSFGLPV